MTNRDFLARLDDQAFGGYGDTGYWSKRAKRMAVDAVGQTARTSLELRAGDSYSPAERSEATAQIEADRQRLLRDARELAYNGYGDTSYWSRRAKHLAFRTATHCCLAASLSDASLQAAMGTSLERALSESETLAFDGYGDTSYWSRRTKRLADEVVDRLPQVGSLSSAALKSELAAHNAEFASELEGMTFGPTGDTGFWSKQAKQVAFKTAVHLGELEQLRAAERDFGSERPLDALIAQMDSFATRLDEKAWSSRGDTDHWSKRAKHLALDVARGAHAVFESCDQEMLEVVAPIFQGTLEEAHEVAFQGWGETRYWSQRAKKLASLGRSALAEAAVELEGLKACQDVKDPAVAGRLRGEAVVAGLERLAGEREAEAVSVRNELSSLDARRAAHYPEEVKLVKRHNVARWVGMGSLVGVIAGMSAMSYAPLVAGPLALASLAGTFGGMYVMHKARERLAEIRGVDSGQADRKSLLERKSQFSSSRRLAPRNA